MQLAFVESSSFTREVARLGLDEEVRSAQWRAVVYLLSVYSKNEGSTLTGNDKLTLRRLAAVLRRIDIDAQG